MSVWVYDTGAWHRAKNIYVHNGSGWQTAEHFWVRHPQAEFPWRDGRAFEAQDMTITIGSSAVTYSYPETAYGYDAATEYDYYWDDTSGFGSISDGGDWFDTLDNNRIVSHCYWSTAGFLYFGTNGTSVPNNDDTFYSIVVTDTFNIEFKRSNATYLSNTNGGTTWWWSVASNPIGTSGTAGLSIRGKAIGG